MRFADVGGVPFVGASSGGDASGMLPALLAMFALREKDDDRGHNWMGMMFLFIVFVIIIFIVVALIWSKGHGGERGATGVAEIAALGMATRASYQDGYGHNHGFAYAQYGHVQHDMSRDLLTQTGVLKEKLAEQTYQLTRDADFRFHALEKENQETRYHTLLGFKDSELRDRDNTDKVVARLDALERRNDERIIAEKDAKINRLETMFAVWGRPPVGGNVAHINTQSIGVGDGYGYGY